MGGKREGRCRLASEEYVGQESRDVEPRLEGPRKLVCQPGVRLNSWRQQVGGRGVCKTGTYQLSVRALREHSCLRASAFLKVGGDTWPRSLGTRAVEMQGGQS